MSIKLLCCFVTEAKGWKKKERGGRGGGRKGRERDRERETPREEAVKLGGWGQVIKGKGLGTLFSKKENWQ